MATYIQAGSIHGEMSESVFLLCNIWEIVVFKVLRETMERSI